MREYDVYKSLRATHTHIEFVKMPSWRNWTKREELENPYDIDMLRHEQLMIADYNKDEQTMSEMQAHLFALAVGIPVVAGILVMPWLFRRCVRRVLRWWMLFEAQRENRQNLFENREAVVQVGGLLFHHQTLPQRRRMRQLPGDV